MDELKYEYILIRFGELTTKGKNKKDFIKKLSNNMKMALSNFEGLVFENTRDHIYIHLNGNDADKLEPVLKKVFGIRSFAKAYKCENDIDQIIEGALKVTYGKQGTFKIKTKRANKQFPLHSEEVNRKVASAILKKYGQYLQVDVHNPDYPIIVEIRDHNTYIMAETILGAQGYPVSVAGRALLMLSGGIDSPVAGYLAMKRGIQIECIHYASMPYTSQAALDKVKSLAKLLAPYQGCIKLHIIPFTDIQLEINKHCDSSYTITMMRRMMYRIANKVALNNHCLALVNGESVSQVASQTLNSMAVISQVSDMPIIRPLVTYDKLEIIDLARKINTYETSILPYEDCCTIFTPKNPVIKPDLKKCLWYENKYDFMPLLEKAIENEEVLMIYPDSNLQDELF
ncbi:MAG: tRNA uracil 4-sulfurtransferase ThiI [Erysipelotrichaceae bacterium]